MKFAILVETKNGIKAAYEWPNPVLMKKIKQKLGAKGVSAFNEIIKEFKKETIKLP